MEYVLKQGGDLVVGKVHVGRSRSSAMTSRQRQKYHTTLPPKHKTFSKDGLVWEF